MPLKILIAPDKFKGTLTAKAAAAAIGRGWQKIRPDDDLEYLPMSDGGDGFGDVTSSALRASPLSLQTLDAAHRACKAQWWWEPKSKTAIIEAAKVNGLAMLPPGTFHPFQLDTYGLGAVIKAAESRGAKHCVVGVGGSATNDGGFGLARSLGWVFKADNNYTIADWRQLDELIEIRPPRKLPRFESLTVAVDVQNPLLGARGCTRIYGPQKGLKPEDFPHAEACLRKMAKVVRQLTGRDIAAEPGAGAAGGLAFGFVAFLNAKLDSGFEVFARHSNLDKRLRAAGLVLTGEGAIDRSTLMGKGVGQLAARCRKRAVPCIGLAGVAPSLKASRGGFTAIHGMTNLTTPAEAMAQPEHWLERLAENVARSWTNKSTTRRRKRDK